MKIISSDAQVLVEDNNRSSGVNIHSLQHGYIADLRFWGGSAYLARRKNCDVLHILIPPGEEWKEEIEQEGFVIIGELNDLAKTQERLNNKKQQTQ